MENYDWLADLAPLHAARESWQNGQYLKQSIFHLNYQSDAPFSICAGAGLLAEHVRRFRFTPEVISRLGRISDERGRSVFDESFLNHLQRMRLRVEISVPHEGMLLLPGEPILIARGPVAQVQLLESAFRVFIWESTHWATQSALVRWKNHDWEEEETPRSPAYLPSPEGWKIRSMFIGGATTDDILENVKTPIREILPDEGLKMVWQTGQDSSNSLTQIRRLYKSTEAVGDVWLNDFQDKNASVSHLSVQILDEISKKEKTLRLTRFQNLYQPAISKGHPLLVSTRKGYFRQRTLHQMAAFHEADLEKYPRGWLIG